VISSQERALADLSLALPVDSLVPGDLTGSETLAQNLLRYEDLFADAARHLGRVDVTWTGAAAEAFHRDFALQPAAFAAAATAFHTAGYALDSYVIAFDSVREAAALALETFQRGVRAAADARAAAAVTGTVPAGGPLDLRTEPAGMQDRLTAVEKLAAARDALDRAGETAADTLRNAMTDAPAQVTALQHLGSFFAGVVNPFADSPEHTEFVVGGARGLLDTALAAANPALPFLSPPLFGSTLDDLQWKAGGNPTSAWSTAGAVVLPMAADGAGVSGVVAKWGGRALRLSTEEEIATGLQAAVPTKGVNLTPEDLYAFGNTTFPRPPRPSDVPSMMDGVIPAQPLPGETFPDGASTYIDPALAPLTGQYHRLPKGTDVTDAMAVMRDGTDRLEKSNHGPGHVTIYPTRDMSLEELQRRFSALPWEYVGRKR